jgi:hypothetical protein
VACLLSAAHFCGVYRSRCRSCCRRVTIKTYKLTHNRIVDVTSPLHSQPRPDRKTEGLLGFAENVLSDPAGLWARADLDQRQRLQKVLFPAGLSYPQAEGFGTG